MATKLVSLENKPRPLKTLELAAKAAKKAADETGAQVVVEVEVEAEREKREYPKEVRIKEAENGYSVCWYDNGGEPWMGGEKTYIAKTLDEAMEHIKEYMG